MSSCGGRGTQNANNSNFCIECGMAFVVGQIAEPVHASGAHISNWGFGGKKQIKYMRNDNLEMGMGIIIPNNQRLDNFKRFCKLNNIEWQYDEK